MNISSLMRSLLGAHPHAEDAKLVELKAGQVVRGVVLKLLADSEALMNIMGTTVRARLETPLAKGQATLLQVQPESADGAIVLKPLTASTAEIAPESLPEVLRAVGLKDLAVNRAIVRGFHSEGLPLPKEIAQELSAAVQAAAPDEQEYAVKAAAVAVRRGLPVTAGTLAALRTAMFGTGIGELLGRLITEASRSSSNSVQTVAPKQGPAKAPVQAPIQPAEEVQIAVGGTVADGVMPDRAVSDDKIAHPTKQLNEKLLSLLVRKDELIRETLMHTSPTTAHNTRQPLLAFLKWLGVDLERQAALQSESTAVTADAPESWAHSLKSELFRLLASDDAPLALKDAAQQTVQWITGQQLLLTSDRSSPFVYATMFIPLGSHPAGEHSEDAAVHIQTQKGKRGEWDAENCRLWFDLRLSNMGAASIDVQVANRIVSIHVYNEHPAALALLEGNKRAIEAALEGIGFRLSSLRASQLFEKAASNAAPSSKYGGADYKGVDIRI